MANTELDQNLEKNCHKEKTFKDDTMGIKTNYIQKTIRIWYVGLTHVPPVSTQR